MPIKFFFKPEAKLLISLHVGNIPDDEFFASYQSLLENESFDPSLNLLVDLRRTDSSQRSRHILEKLARLVGATYADPAARPKIGVIAPKDLSFGLARMYEAFAESIPLEFAVFRTMEEVLAWMGLGEDALPKELKPKKKR